MLTNAMQPTGVYSAFQRPASVANAAGGNVSNSLSSNGGTLSDGSLEKTTQKAKKTPGQKLPYLAALAVAGSFAVIYGFPALRGSFRKFVAENQEKIDKIPLINSIKSKKTGTVFSKISTLLNRFCDALENKTQKSIKKFLKTNFFKY